MGAPASKRRKIEHASPRTDDDGSSFVSFGDSEAGDLQDRAGPVQDSIGDVEDAASEEEDEEDEERGTNGVPIDGANVSASGQLASKQLSRPTPKNSSTPRKRLVEERAYSSGNFKSNVFKLQVDELLEQVRPRHGKRESAAEAALHAIKSTIEQMPPRPALPVDDAERKLQKIDKVVIPFPNPRPPKNAKYKLEYRQPANVNVAGSYALKTASRARETIVIDMVLTMPSELFQEKDYLNHRYYYKRAYYLACVAAQLKGSHREKYDVLFESLHDNALEPSIVARLREKDSKAKWQINILACVAEDIFSSDKLLLEKNCVRSPEATAPETGASTAQFPTPFYNSSLRADMLVTTYLKLLHSASKTCEAFRDACLLGSIWLRQRRLKSNMHGGGFGNFEWSALMAIMLGGGGPKGTPILSAGYSSYQLFKATLQVLAMKDMSKQPFVVGTTAYSPSTLQDGTPVVWDAERGHNLLYKMSTWAYRRLRQEARITLDMLGDQQYDGFDATFILRSDTLLHGYDCVLEMPAGVNKGMSYDHEPHVNQHKLFRALQEGLGDRVTHINVIPSESSAWSVDAARPLRKSSQPLRVSLVVNPETVGRTVDHGPLAEEKSDAAAFRKFWGEKAELRRFKDGSITESLVWSEEEGGQSVLEQIVRYVLNKHVGETAKAGITFFGDTMRKLLPQGPATTPFQSLHEAYKQMESDIRGLEGLPLSVRQIMPADGQLRSASLHTPLTGPRPVPADVVIQFEGSGRWPDDLVAIQRTKIAFLLKLSELLQDSVSTASARIGLENQQHDTLNQAYLDIIYDTGAAFRMRIYHDREHTLFERQLKDKSSDPQSKEVAALGLAKHKRDYLKSPAHTQAIAGLCSRHPAMSGTVRLMKKWFASHLLANHISDEVIELLVAKTFVQPWPWQTPSSVQTGLLRTLFFLSRWDWRADPLIVDLSRSGDLKQADVQSITTKFEAWRKIDPALNRVVLFAASNVDHDGTTWTDGRTAKVVAGRMTALAKAAHAEIKDKELSLEPASLFSSPLGDFDFVLHLSPEFIGKKEKLKRKGKQSSSNGTGFKNLDMEALDDKSLAGHDPVREFLQELETLFGAVVLLFSGGQVPSVIAGLWNPQTAKRAWKLNLAYSTVPKVDQGAETAQAEVNKDAMLAEMARLGGEMIERIDVNKT